MRNNNIDYQVAAKDIKNFISCQQKFRITNLTSNDVAQAVGISRTSLMKIFKEIFGCSFLDYLNKCRVQYARHAIMVNKSSTDLEKVALMSGYTTMRNFNNKYKVVYGETPAYTLKQLNIKHKDKTKQ